MKRSNVYRIVILTIALLIGLASCSQTTPAPTLEPGDSPRTLTVDGLARQYFLHIPPNINSQDPVPVVFVFHDWYDDATRMKNIGHLDDLADENGFIILYPEGLWQSWNAGECCGDASANNVDDVGFVRQLLVELETMVKVDPKRIYATGYSGGGMLAYRLACEMSDTFAAIAPVNGILWYSPCQPEEPVSVFHVHGLADAIIPYAGGRSEAAGAVPEPVGGWDLPPAEQGITTWAQLNGCTGTPAMEQQDNITYTTYESCQDGTTVQLITIDGFGHGWINSAITPTVAPKNIWEFFAAHPKQ